MPAIEIKEDFAYLNIRVKTNAKKTEIKEIDDETIYISLAALADRERANNELIRLLSDTFEVPKSSIFFVSGHHSNLKIIRIKNTCEVERQLKILLDQKSCCENTSS